MKRCNECFRYSVGQPPYCPYCGRSYDVRLCSRGHANARNMTFCATCGSDDLSTPAPPEGRLARLSRWSLRVIVATAAACVALAVAAGIVASVDWSVLTGPLTGLVLMCAALYWTTTLLPGPVKRIGRDGARQARKALTGRRKA